MNEIRLTDLGDSIKNEKRVFILRVLLEEGSLTWSQLVEKLESRFAIRLNPNTLSFHLKYLIDKGLVKKRTDDYVLLEQEIVKSLIELGS